MKSQIIKLSNKSTNEKERLAYFASKTISLDCFLPYSYIQILDLISLYGNTLNRQEIALLAVKKKIVYKEQVVLNYISTLCKFGLLVKTEKGYVEVSKKLLK